MCNVRMLSSIILSCLCALAFAEGKDVVTVIKDDKRVERPVIVLPSKDAVGKTEAEDRAQRAVGLREYGFWSQAIRYGPKEANAENSFFNTALYAWYESTGLDNLESYTYVQYLRGCVFVSQLDANMVEERGLGVTRSYFGVRTVFVHREWQIDSDDELPMFGSSKSQPLQPHYFMEWGGNPNKFPDRSQKLYGEDPPNIPRLYIRANVEPAAHVTENVWGLSAINHSLEFRMCLYRSKDVAGRTDKHAFIENPIDCFSWESSFVYDFKAKKFNSPKGILPICQPDVMPSAEKKWEFK